MMSGGLAAASLLLDTPDTADTAESPESPESPLMLPTAAPPLMPVLAETLFLLASSRSRWMSSRSCSSCSSRLCAEVGTHKKTDETSEG